VNKCENLFSKIFIKRITFFKFLGRLCKPKTLKLTYRITDVRRALLGPEKLKVTIKNDVNKLNGIEGKIRILNIL
jgi:hypothetical protein